MSLASEYGVTKASIFNLTRDFRNEFQNDEKAKEKLFTFIINTQIRS